MADNKLKSQFLNGYSFLFHSIFSYSTVREARIHSFKVALLFRLFQLGIIGYIIGWSIIYNKGYQKFETVSSTVTSKVKGFGYIIDENSKKLIKYTNGKFVIKTGPVDKYRIFDTADYVIPPAEYNSIFVMTNFIETKQTQDLCDEDFNKVNCICQIDDDCVNKIVFSNTWNGIPTGRCINSSFNSTLKVCEIASWCPVEREIKENTKNLIQNVENYTIFIKNDVIFETFNKKQRNILSNITNDYISKCVFDRDENPYCPVFLIKNILEEAEPDAKERAEMFEKGGVVLIGIEWDCNFDYSKACLPKYTFNRFDVSFKQASGASGFNFRFSDRFEINGTMYRILVKAYGLRFIINVSGKAGKFNFIPLLLTIGAGLGLLSVATIIADCILLNLTSKKKFYRDLKELDYRKSNVNDKSPAEAEIDGKF